MKVYYRRWSQYLKAGVAEAEERDPSRKETFNKLYQQTTVEQKTFWSEKELIKHLTQYMSSKGLCKTGNLLDIMVGQRMGYGPDQIKTFLGAVKQAFKDNEVTAQWETTPEAIYLLKR